MSFRKPCHMPFRKLIPPFTLTVARVLVGDGGLTSLEVRITCISNIPAIFEASLNLFVSRKI